MKALNCNALVGYGLPSKFHVPQCRFELSRPHANHGNKLGGDDLSGMRHYPPQFKLTHYPGLTLEHNMNYVLSSFREGVMVKAVQAVIQEAAALASLALFVGMIFIWSQVLGNL